MDDFMIARRAVGTAKFAAFHRQAYRLAALAKAGVVDRAGAVDCLTEIAVAHSFGAIDVALAEAFNSRVPDAYHKAASYDEEEAA